MKMLVFNTWKKIILNIYVSQSTFHLSSNINEVIRAISSLFIYFFYKKISHTKKSTKKQKNAHKRAKTKKAAFLCA